jgi:hypothetical protein
MQVDEARAALQVAQQAFDEASEILLHACMRQAGLEMALKRGLQPSDTIVGAIDKDLASASMELWQARQARDQAADALQVAQRPPMKLLLETQLKLVRVHDAKLFARHEAELAAISEARDDEALWRARHILGNTKMQILRYQAPSEVAS